MLYHAVTIPVMNSTLFLIERPEAHPDVQVEDQVELVVPSDLARWPEGARRPHQILCRATTNPKQYRVFKYQEEINPSEFTPTGRTYGGIYSTAAWHRFLEGLPRIRDFYSIPDDSTESETSLLVPANDAP